MTKRLQVLLDDDELAEIQRAARGQRMTTAAWVRKSLRTARDAGVASDPRAKLAAVREAATFSFPVADIDHLLEEIERGYLDEPPDGRP